MITMFIVLLLCIMLYVAVAIKRIAEVENDWQPVNNAMIASQFPQCISDSGQLMAFPQYDREFLSFHLDGMVKTPFTKVSPGRRYVYPFDWLDPTVTANCFHNTVPC